MRGSRRSWRPLPARGAGHERRRPASEPDDGVIDDVEDLTDIEREQWELRGWLQENGLLIGGVALGLLACSAGAGGSAHESTAR